MVKPPIGIDLDGVICRPPLGLNLSIYRGPYVGRKKRSLYPKFGENPLVSLVLTLKYMGRRPMYDARSGLQAIREHRDLFLVTSRNSLVHDQVVAWLSHNDLLPLFSAIHTNDSGLPSPEFKERKVRELGISEFVDDDGRVADYLARRGLARIYLRDWPRNHGYRYADNVTRVPSLLRVATLLAERDGEMPPGAPAA